MEVDPPKADCGKYTVLVGLINVKEEYLTDANKLRDLNAIKDRINHKILHINTYIKSLCDYYDRGDKTADGAKKTKDTVQNTAMNLEKFVSRDEFFVYSVSVTFNPKIRSINDLLRENNEGDGVCTITVKMPKDKKRQTFYLKLMLKLISKNSVVLKVATEGSALARSIKSPRAPAGPESKAAESVPGYFDEDYKESEMNPQGAKYVKAGENSYGSYSFFNQSSMILSKYVNSNLVVREDDRIVADKLMREKEKKKKAESKRWFRN